MNKILGSLVLFSFTFLSAGSITATVDTKEVLEGDSVLLTLSIVGKDITPIPEIEEIGAVKVDNIQRRSGTNFVHVNGVTSMEHSQILILEFRPKSSMTIPSFSVKVDGEMKQTDPIKIVVRKSATGMKRSTKNFSLDVKIEKSKFYLGEPVVLTIYFKQRTDIDVMQIDYKPPKFKDFFSKQLGEGETYKKGIFTIQELNYLLIPKKAGKLILEPAHAKVAQRSRERQQGGWYIDVPKWTQLSSDSLIVQVDKPNKAHDIVGDYKLTEKIDHQKVKVNRPVTLHLELTGMGTLDDYDGITFNIPNVTIYSDDAKIESKLLGKELQSHYQKSFVFISDHDFIIPSKRIRVYNYKTKKVKLLKTKEYHITVEGASKRVSNSIVHTNETLQDTHLPSSIALLVAFVFGVLSTLAINYLPSSLLEKWKLKKLPNRYDEALKILYPKLSESKEVEEMVRKLYARQNGDKSVKIEREQLEKLVTRYKD